MGTHIGEGGGGRLLHHVAQLAGESEAAFSRHPSCFNENNIAASGGPGQAGGQTGPPGTGCKLRNELDRSKILLQVVRSNPSNLLSTGSNLFGYTPADSGDFPFERLSSNE